MIDILERIDAASRAAREALQPFHQRYMEAAFKAGDDPVTAADLAVDAASGRSCPAPGRASPPHTDEPHP